MSTLCACGCGGHTKATLAQIKRGGKLLYARGEFFKFKQGHNRKTVESVRRYRAVARKGSSVALHRAIAERALGKPLPKGAVVHHVDGDKHSRSPRLVICQDAAYHNLLHARQRVVKSGGRPDADKICYKCGTLKPRLAFQRNAHRSDGCSDECKRCRSMKAGRL